MNINELVAKELKVLADTYNTQYVVECGDVVILATDSLVEAAKEIECMPTSINCVVVLLSRNGDTMEVLESFFGGKPHRQEEFDTDTIVKLLSK